MSSTVLSIAALITAMPGMVANFRKSVDERPFFGTGQARKTKRRIDYTAGQIDSFGTDHCPDKLHWQLSLLRRQLAAIHEMTYDDTENHALNAFWPTPFMLAGLLVWMMTHPHPSNWLEVAVVLIGYVAVAFWTLPALDVQARLSSRRALYAYLGPSPDIPELPPITWRPGRPRIPRPRHLTRIARRVIGPCPVPVDTITTAQVDELRIAIETWCNNTWLAKANRLATTVRSLVSRLRSRMRQPVAPPGCDDSQPASQDSESAASAAAGPVDRRAPSNG